MLTPIDGTRVPADLPGLCGESPLRFRRMDRYSALGFAAARLALGGSGALPAGRGDPDWGILLGSSLGCWSSNARYFEDLRERPASELSPSLFTRTVSNAVNGEISIAFQIGGVNETFVSGWAAGAEALAAAAALLAERRATRVLTGGLEAPDEVLEEMHHATRQQPGMGWLPESLAEGAAMCVLAAADHEPLEVAGRARLLGYWRGYDPRGEWSLSTVVSTLQSRRIGTAILANTVPPGLRRRFSAELAPAHLVVLPDRTGEIGAAGAGAAVALAAERIERGDRSECILVVARGIEGNTVVLALSG